MMRESHELTKRVTEIRDLGRPDEMAAPIAPPIVTYGVENNTENEVQLLDYWRAVRKRLWLVLGVAALVTLLTAIYMARKPDIFESTARLQVDVERNPALAGVSKSAPIVLSNSVTDPAYFNTQLQILGGPALLRRVAKTLDLEHNQSFLRPQTQRNRSTWQSLLRMFGMGAKDNPADKNPSLEELPLVTQSAQNAVPDNKADLIEAKRLAPFVGALQGGLKIEPVKENRTGFSKDTRLIDIRFDHPDPQVAAKVVNTIADTYVLMNLEKREETSNSTNVYLERRIAQLQQDIRTDEERLVNYTRNNQMLSINDKDQNVVVDRLAGLNRQLLEAENDRVAAEGALRAAQADGAAAALTRNDDRGTNEAESKLAALRQKRAELLVENTKEWPEVKETDQQIAVLEEQIKSGSTRATSTLLTNLQTRYNQAKSREDALRASFTKQKAETLTQNEAAINYKIIQQGIDTNKELLNGLLQRNGENDVINKGTMNNIYVVDYALTPDGPLGPQRMRAVFLALIASIGFGIGLALFLEYLDDTVHSTDDVEKMLHLPALAVIPSASQNGGRRFLPGGGGNGALQTRNGNGGSSTELLVNMDARSPLAEAYRQLRTSVLLSTAGRAPRSLLITSSLPGEGKTTTAVNTAFSLAQTGTSVVIIDADMRRPRLHSIFDTSNRRGLSSILSTDMTEAEMLSMIEQHQSSGLHVLTSGPIPPNPAELLGSEQMRRLVRALESTFTHIVIDSPPISSFTDGVLVSSMVDGVLLVVHGGKSSRHVVRRSRQLLQDVGAKIFGVVLNNVNLRGAHDYYYYQRYYNQQGYYSADEEEAEQPVASSTQV
jgi:succinoglycan biosynthesis transport protein ExoP